jgi:hypothetical protein
MSFPRMLASPPVMTSMGPLARRTISEVILQATMIEVHMLRAILVSCCGFLVYASTPFRLDKLHSKGKPSTIYDNIEIIKWLFS